MGRKCHLSASCPFDSGRSFQRYIRHVKGTHWIARDIPCNFRNNCTFVAKDVVQLVQHAQSEHPTQDLKRAVNIQKCGERTVHRIVCQEIKGKYCDSFASVKDYNKHIKSMHSNSDYKFQCIFKNCSLTHDNAILHLNHVRRHQQSIDEVKKCYLQEYKENYEVVPDDPVVDVCLDDMRDITDEVHLEDTTDYDDQSTDFADVSATTPSLENQEILFADEQITFELVKFLIDLHVNKYVPWTTIQYIITTIKAISEISVVRIISRIQGIASRLRIPQFTMDEISTKIQDNHLYKALMKVNTRHKFDGYVSKHFKYITPTELKIDNITVGHHTDLKKLLSNVIKDDAYKRVTTKEMSRDSDLLKYHRDSGNFKSNPFFQENPDAIPFIMHSDAISPVDALGSAKNDYHLLKVFITFLDIPLWMQSSLTSKYAVLTGNLAKAKGKEDLLYEPIIQNLKELEEGIEINGKIVKAAPVAFLADGLEAHQLLGLPKSFSARFICRFCIGLYRDLDGDKITAKRTIWRNLQMHKKVMRDLEINELCNSRSSVFDDNQQLIGYQFGLGDITQDEVLSVENVEYEQLDQMSKDALSELPDDHQDLGWKKPPIFRDLKAFNPILSHPPDPLHDWAEGFASYEVADVLSAIFRNDLVVLEHFNMSLKNLRLDISVDERRDFPKCFGTNQVKTMTKLPSKGQSTKLLVRYLPLILEGLMDTSEALFILLKKLALIQELVYSEEVNKTMGRYLQSLLESYFDIREKVAERYNLKRPKPKHHWLLHYPGVLGHFGPWRLADTKRYESKHTETKSGVLCTKNFINITYSVSRMDNLRIALLHETGLYPYMETKTYKAPVVALDEVAPFLEPGDAVYDEIVFRNIKFSQGSCVLLKLVDLDTILVGVINQFITKEKPIIVVSQVRAKRFLANSYYVLDNPSIISIKKVHMDSLPTMQCLKIIRRHQKKLIVLKSSLLFTDLNY